MFSKGHSMLLWSRHSLAIAYFAGLIVWEIWDADWGDPLAVALSLLAVAYLALIVTTYFRRGPTEPLRRGDRFAQVVAVLGANLLIPLSLLPSQYPDFETIAVIASFMGLAFSFWALWHLGVSFSIVPEARHLVQTGPYRWIRHPLYLAGFVIGLGLLGAKLSPAALGLFLGFVGSQALRMDYEEQVLADTLPEYLDYRRRTWALLPYVF